VDWSGTGYGQVESCCEYCDEPSVSIQSENMLAIQLVASALVFRLLGANSSASCACLR
jgi:hypothetical protein